MVEGNVKNRVVLVRHGESVFNADDKFTGWYDALLTPKGLEEAELAGHYLLRAHYTFDEAYTSLLTRSMKTAEIILKKIDQTNIPVTHTWRLNERHYGALTGFNKGDLSAQYGYHQVVQWRRSFDIPPPAMKPSHPLYDIIMKDERYKDGPTLDKFPTFETMRMTRERVRVYWEHMIGPRILAGKRVLIVSHGNSLRSLIVLILQMDSKTMHRIKMPPTAVPVYFDLDDHLHSKVDYKIICDDKVQLLKIRDKMAKQLE